MFRVLNLSNVENYSPMTVKTKRHLFATDLDPSSFYCTLSFMVWPLEPESSSCIQFSESFYDWCSQKNA